MPAPDGPIVLICGVRADGTLRAIEITDSDELKIALATATGSDLLTELEAKLETADLELVSKILSTGSHGWISGALQKQPIILGYSERVAEGVSAVSDGVGDQDVTTTPVPAGEIHIIHTVSAYHNDPTARGIGLYAFNGSISAAMSYTPTVAQWALELALPGLVLAEDDYIISRCFALGNTKTIYMQIWGVRIDIDQ